MYEHLASFFGPPNLYHFDLYSEWAKHQWGMILTGNVEVSADHLTLGRDMITPKHITDENLVLSRKCRLSIFIWRTSAGVHVWMWSWIPMREMRLGRV